jgi:hypothetical protein
VRVKTQGSALIAEAVVSFMLGCGPEVDDAADDGIGDPLGTLVYAHPAAEFYRLDRRIEVVAIDPMRSRDGCGYLTDRADGDISSTVEALDPTVDYNVWTGCLQTIEPKGRVYLEGFEHSPFACDWRCCHPELYPIELVYYAVENNLFDQEPVIDGEPYVALEPDRPCE